MTQKEKQRIYVDTSVIGGCLDRINAYNAVNESRGFRRLTIVTPLEVTRAIYEEDPQDI